MLLNVHSDISNQQSTNNDENGKLMNLVQLGLNLPPAA